ncbi:MAG: HAD family phosphatase [Akkermansiaceae bacterium]|nr:HAD family phosphatase [Akkermansiaceae bacterium]
MDFLFDIGNVIVGVDFLPALKRLIPSGTENVDARLHALLERKDEFEAGRVAADEYFPWAAEVLGFAGSHQQFIDAWLDIFSPNPPMWECIESLHQEGHRLILFSNINNPHKEYLMENYPVFQCFTGGVFSYQTGHIKPEADIYQLAIKQYGLTPGKTGYIDDLPANIAGGKNAGFLCHEYRADRHDRFLQWLSTQI